MRSVIFVLLALGSVAAPSYSATNASIIMRESAFTKLVRELGAQGETDTLKWRIRDPQISINAAGVRLTGKISLQAKRADILRQPIRQPTRGISTPVQPLLLRPREYSFSVPMGLSVSTSQVTLAPTSRLVVRTSRRSPALISLDVKPFYSVRAGYSIPRFSVSGSSTRPRVDQIQTQRFENYLKISARVRP